MTIPSDEVSLPLVEAVQQATGRRVNLSTAFRWCQSRNRYGNRLSSWLIGGRRVTSVESVLRYLESNTVAADRLQIPVATDGQKRRAHAEALAELDREFSN